MDLLNTIKEQVKLLKGEILTASEYNAGKENAFEMVLFFLDTLEKQNENDNDRSI